MNVTSICVCVEVKSKGPHRQERRSRGFQNNLGNLDAWKGLDSQGTLGQKCCLMKSGSGSSSRSILVTKLCTTLE
jgi:hypothetical protein